MNVFITGATGFIGRRLISMTESDVRFEKIHCICRKETDFHSRINVITCSLEELHKIQPIEADVCIHLAAVTDSTAANRKDIFKTNADGTEKVVEFCKKSGIPRIVFLSSANVYLKRKYSYASSKIRAEEYIKKSGLKYSILRCSLVYGADCPSFDKIIKFADKLHLVPVLGSGNSYKQPIYIDEVCREIINCIFTPDENAIRDLYGKTKMTYNEMVKGIISVSRKRALIIHLPVAPFLLLSELCYNSNIPFPIYPEQISHMCENTCSDADSDSSHPDDFFNNLQKYIH